MEAQRGASQALSNWGWGYKINDFHACSAPADYHLLSLASEMA